MPGIDFGKVRELISIGDVLVLLGFQPLEWNEKQFRGVCPFRCGSSRRAFVGYLESDRYYCFHCHRSGNQLKLWAALRNLSIYDAAQDLCDQLGIAMPVIHRW
jgi:DNA primase